MVGQKEAILLLLKLNKENAYHLIAINNHL